MQLWYEDFVKIGDEIWAASGIFNGLFKYNLSDKRVDFITHFNEEKMIGQRLFSGVVEYEKKIYFIPYFATCFYSYDISKGNLETVGIRSDKSQLLNLCCIYKSKIVMFHNSKDLMLIYDIKTEEFHTIYNVKKENDILGYYVGKGTVFNNQFYIGNSYNNVIVSIDLNNLSVLTWKIGAPDNTYYVIDQFEEQLLVKDGKGNICTINLYTFEQCILGNVCQEMWVNNVNDTVILMNNTLYIFSFERPYVKQFNLEKKENRILYIEKEDESTKYINLIRQWGYIKKVDNRILFNSNRDFSSYLFDGELLKTDFFTINKQIFQQILEQAVEEDQEPLLETQCFQLKNFLKVHSSINQNCLQKECGEMIFQECIKA